jgi:hypothetical protein
MYRYLAPTKTCMICGITGVSVLACNLPPHGDKCCNAFTCVSCSKIVQDNATICPNREAVCLVQDGCKVLSTLGSPTMLCKCGRKVCANCYTREDFIDNDGVCQICIEKEVIDEIREEERSAAEEPSAKRAKLGDSNGEAR